MRLSKLKEIPLCFQEQPWLSAPLHFKTNDGNPNPKMKPRLSPSQHSEAMNIKKNEALDTKGIARSNPSNPLCFQENKKAREKP